MTELTIEMERREGESKSRMRVRDRRVGATEQLLCASPTTCIGRAKS